MYLTPLATSMQSKQSHVDMPSAPFPPYFGPLASANPDLDGLVKSQALARIKRQMYHHLKTIAPENPGQHLPHKRHHIESVPRLATGTGFSGQLNAGRWYQFCETCDRFVIHYLTDALDSRLLTGASDFGRLYDTFQEIRQYEDGDFPSTGSAATRVRYERRSEQDDHIVSSPAAPGLKPFPCPSPLQEFFD
ncbi:hypothetical protein GALMADRAFT_244864 [Galerina marginata CBS 339.88]|uniref:Uncharacterized protein n=1 Tax=Galerina marginata (strain CBS 339.88) TaxID=685588 RepID=A0A067TDD3_GALM3|nr:hypothetical protein GALMADRAFT_244864 [Galerina marginata CBS 339.88]